MKKNSLLNKILSILAILFMAACLLGIIAILILDLYKKIERGWNANDTITIVFYVIVSTSFPVMIKSFYDFFTSNCKEVIIFNNEIYRLFIELEQNDSICNYERLLINRNNERYLNRINSIVKRKNDGTRITMSNLGEYFTDSGLYSYDINIISFIRLNSLYEKIMKNKSIEYEKLYQSVHSGELIKKYKFPLFEFVIPLLVSCIGLFATIYQTLAMSDSIHDSLTEYFKLFGSTLLLTLVFILVTFRSYKEGRVEFKTNQLKDLKAVKAMDNQ